MYNSVEKYFKKEFPGLAESLDNSGGFWPNVKNNKITNKELAHTILSLMKIGNLTSHVFLASIALLCARLTGVVRNPK